MTILCAPLAQLDRASDYGSEGLGFESLRACHFLLASICWLFLYVPNMKSENQSLSKWSNLIQIYRMMFKYWFHMIMGLITMFCFAIFSGISITLMIPLFDYVFKPGKTGIIYQHYDQFLIACGKAVTDFTAQYGSLFSIRSLDAFTPLWTDIQQIMLKTDSLSLLYMLCVLIFVLMLLKNISYFANRMFFVYLRGNTIRDVRNYMFDRYLNQSLEFYNQNQVGDSIVRMVNDVENVSNQFINSLLNSIRDIITILVYMRIALYLNSRLFLMSALVLPVFSVTVGVLGKKIKKYSKRIQEQLSTMFSNVEEVLNSMKIVKAFRREDQEFRVFQAINSKHLKMWQRSQIYASLNVPISEINSTITGIVVIIIGGAMIVDPKSGFSLGSFTTFLFALFSMLAPLKSLTQMYTDVKKAVVSLDRISLVMNQQSTIQDTENPVSKKSFDRSIDFEHVGFYYKQDKPILKDINLQIPKGQKIAFVGSSGGGKTTVANLINRMYDVKSGAIKIDGIDIRDILLDDLRRLFGIVTQESILFTKSVRENIAYGTWDDVSDEQIAAAARIAHADEFIQQLPNKYDQILDTKGANLSGGQRQRLCIARAIVGNPPILIFDEATSALDTESERNVQEAINAATRNRTVIIIAHRLSTVLSSDCIVVLERGEIVGIGKHEELLQTCERYRFLNNLQFEA